MKLMPAQQHPPGFHDIRMRGFARRTTVADAWSWLDAQLAALPSETVSLADAAGRVLAADVTSSVDVPMFDRSMMDGFAVHAADTQGATPYNRLSLTVMGEALPGRAYGDEVRPGHAVRIMTGARLPRGADAVLPAERAEVDGQQIQVLDEVSPGKHVGCRGEDIPVATLALSAGRRLRPQDLGVLSSIGAATIQVYRQPRVRIVVTGDELLPAGSTPTDSHISDANGPMLSALVARDGGLPINPGIVADRPEESRAALQTDADVVLVSGGSSVGQEDHAPLLLARHGELAIHGVAMRPSSPAGMGRLGSRLVFLLPGNPVSCLCAYDFFAGRAIRALGGRSKAWPYRICRWPLRRKLVSTIGRLDYARVQVINGQVEPLAISGASVLSSTTRADGFVLVPESSEGFPAGADVEVYLYDAV